MRRPTALTRTVLWIACLGFALPQSTLMAAQPRPPASAASQSAPVVDVALGPHSSLDGILVDPQGVPVPAEPIVLLEGARQVAVTRTDAQGRFGFENIRGGVYAIATARIARVCRLWAPRTAPPAANQGLLLVSGGQTVRARGPMRDCQSRIYTWVSEHYLITYAAIAAAIAVPVAIIGSNQDDGPKS